MRRFALLLLACASCAGAFEPRDVRGLDVRIEPLPEPVAVDGVQFEIVVASGSDVTELARRVEHRWREQGSTVQHLQQHGWQLASRWDAGRSELMQWRGEGGAAQLVFSRLDTLKAPVRPGRGPLLLPSRCAWNRQIADRSHTVSAATCRLALPQLQRQVRAALLAQGWSVQRETAALLEITRDGSSARLTLVPAARPGESAIVWTQIAPAAPGSLQ